MYPVFGPHQVHPPSSKSESRASPISRFQRYHPPSVSTADDEAIQDHVPTQDERAKSLEEPFGIPESVSLPVPPRPPHVPHQTVILPDVPMGGEAGWTVNPSRSRRSLDAQGRFDPTRARLSSIFSFNPEGSLDTSRPLLEADSHRHIPPRLEHPLSTGFDTNLRNIQGHVFEHIEGIQCALPSLHEEQLRSLKNLLEETVQKIDSSLSPTPGVSKTEASGKNEEWCCFFCTSVTKTRATFKRHLNDQHFPRSIYRCPEQGCDVVACRRDRISAHISFSHYRVASRFEIAACEEERSCPHFCPLCSRQTDSWDNFYQCLLGHSFVNRAECEETSALGSPSDPTALTLPKAEMRRLTQTRETSHRVLQSPTPVLSSVIQPEKKAQNSIEGAPNFNTAEGSLLTRPKAPEKTQALSQSDEILAQQVKERRHVQGDGEYRSVTYPPPDFMRHVENAGDSEEIRATRSRRNSPGSTRGNLSQTSHQENGRQNVLRGTSFLSERSLIPHSEDRSTTGSIETSSTSLEEGDEDIDAGIPDNGDMEYILCPATYYENLDKLEVKTAELCGIRQGPKIQGSTPSEFFRTFRGIRDALQNLQVEGFCGKVMSIFVEDHSRPDVANTVHILLDDIDRFICSWQERGRWLAPLAKSCSQLNRKLFGDSLFEQLPKPGLSGSGLLYCRFLSTVLSIGLVSFSGSHVCRFDRNLWGQEMNELPVGCGYSFFPRQLACLKDFIGGPAWVLCRSETQAEQNRLKVSLMVQDLQELWGPVWLVGGAPDAGPIVRTERGYIVPLPRQTTPGISSDEIECHWTTENPGHIDREQPIQLSSTSRILIGTDSVVAPALTHNLDCQSDIGRIQAHIYRQLPITGTCKERLTGGDYEVQLTGGQFVNMGLVKKFKRYPMRTRKMSLIEECKTRNIKLIPLLKLRIGLEVSACTGNAQRVTLWDALRLSQQRPCQTGRVSYCDHRVADTNCIRSCWTRCSPTDDIDSDVNIPRESSKMSTADIRRLIIDSIVALEHTGIDHEGNLQACWPFTDVRRTRCIKRSTANESNNWLRAIEDTPEVATFAVVSQRCLEFRQQAHSAHSRPCSITCKSKIGKINSVLSTRILLNPSIGWSCKETEPNCVGPGMPPGYETLSPGDMFVIGEAILTIKGIVPGRQMVAIATSAGNPVQSKMAKAFRGWKIPRFCEDADPELAPGLSVVALVIY